MQALEREARLLAQACGSPIPVHTIYFGGGTPSILPAVFYASLLKTIRAEYAISADPEITLEANPGTLDRRSLAVLRRTGVNRISLGVQSAQPSELELLGRVHDFKDVIRSTLWARQAGFENISMDLMFGLPGQTLGYWQNSLEQVVGLGPDHLSLYALTLESGTNLHEWVSRGRLQNPDDDLSADMYEWASEWLASNGFQQYEISNWSRLNGSGEARVCRHNLQYWRNLPYIGLGAGAHGFLQNYRLENVATIPEYLQLIAGSESFVYPFSAALAHKNFIDLQTEMEETMMVGLRLTEEGVSPQVFLERFGVQVEKVFGQQMDDLRRNGLLEWNGPIRLTPRARLIGNQVFMRFISLDEQAG